MKEENYDPTVFVLSPHYVKHLSEMSKQYGVSMQEVLERCLAAPHKNWCNECWQSIHRQRLEDGDNDDH